MYTWWIRFSPQTPSYETGATRKKILKWGAQQMDSSVPQNTLQIGYRSDKNPTRFLNKLVKQGDLSTFGITNRTKTGRLSRKKVAAVRPEKKANAFTKALKHLKNRRLVP